MKAAKFGKDTILIGHSAGDLLVLSILKNINKTIHKAIIVSGYAKKKGQRKQAELILQDKYNWKKIKRNVKNLMIINSDNDPWGYDSDEGLYIWNHAGDTLILREGEGRVGSDSFGQPYSNFPLLEKLLELKYSRAVVDGSDKN